MTDTTTRTEVLIHRGAAEAGAPRLTALPGVAREDAAPPRVLEVERYDTAGHRLAAAGIALALHRGDEEQGYWHLELPDGDSAEQLRVALGPDAPPSPDVPGELAELVRGAARKDPLHPVGRIRRVRTVTRLLGDEGALGTVVHDHVTIATQGSSTEGVAWTEAELCDVADDALGEELRQRVAEAGLRPAASAAEAELDRLLRPAPQPSRAPHGGGKRGSAGAALTEYLAAHVERIAAEDLRVRRGEPDAVHQLRVAARRVRSALQAYRRLLDRDRTEPLVDGLRELGRALAPARDAEVLHARIRSSLAELDPELLLGPVQAQVTRHYARVEAEAAAAVLATLDAEPYARLRTALDHLVQRPPLTKRAARPARKELPAHVARAARRLDRAVATAVGPGRPDDERDVAVHSARKAGKRLRYATEVARPAVGGDAKRFAKSLKGFQKALGEHQDTVVARNALRELGALAHADGENGFAFGVLHGRDAARAARIEEDLPQLWAQAWQRRNRRWLR
jgi:CHAD domain-containing protein